MFCVTQEIQKSRYNAIKLTLYEHDIEQHYIQLCYFLQK